MCKTLDTITTANANAMHHIAYYVQLKVQQQLSILIYWYEKPSSPITDVLYLECVA